MTDNIVIELAPATKFVFSPAQEGKKPRFLCIRCGWNATGVDSEQAFVRASEHQCEETQFGFARRSYGVPAARGRRVLWDEKPGRITSAKGSYLMVELDEPYDQYFAAFDKTKSLRRVLAHPTWKLVYHTPWGNFDFSKVTWATWDQIEARSEANREMAERIGAKRALEDGHWVDFVTIPSLEE